MERDGAPEEAPLDPPGKVGPRPPGKADGVTCVSHWVMRVF